MVKINIEVSVGNEILRTVKGTFENGIGVSDFISSLMRDEGYSPEEIYVYATNTGILKRYDELLADMGE